MSSRDPTVALHNEPTESVMILVKLYVSALVSRSTTGCGAGRTVHVRIRARACEQGTRCWDAQPTVGTAATVSCPVWSDTLCSTCVITFNGERRSNGGVETDGMLSRALAHTARPSPGP